MRCCDPRCAWQCYQGQDKEDCGCRNDNGVSEDYLSHGPLFGRLCSTIPSPTPITTLLQCDDEVIRLMLQWNEGGKSAADVCDEDGISWHVVDDESEFPSPTVPRAYGTGVLSTGDLPFTSL